MTDSSSADAETGELYRGSLAAREAEVARLAQVDTRVGYLRLLLAVVFVALLWWWHHDRGCPWWCSLAPVLCFGLLAAYHSRVLRRAEFVARSVTFYRNGLGRLEDRWAESGQSEKRGAFAESLFAAALDLFGPKSMFALLSQARSRIGEDVLAGWLLAPAPVAEVLRRQEAVRELRQRLDLREDAWAVAPPPAQNVHARGNHEELFRWAEQPVLLPRSWVRYAALAVCIAAAACALWWFSGHSRLPFFLVVLGEAGIAYAHRRRIGALFAEAERALADLDTISALLSRFEQETFKAPLLCDLQASLRSGGGNASQAITGLRRLGMYIDSRDNVFVRVFNVPLLYDVQLGYAAEAWRRVHGGNVRQWLPALGAFEALLSLAGYSAEHPTDPFPEFVGGAASFDARSLGHPLLPAAQCVRNDVGLAGDNPVALISGSNMSGKSTLLRAVGLNAVLAMAGAPVRAASLRMSPLAVGASILVNDSLMEGSSRFYAELRRLRAICDRALHLPPLLFLIDELLEGTNSRDRQAGAAGILRTLADRGAIGLTTTHDLALTSLQGTARMRNLHFEDAVVQGEMVFDYRLREGVVTRSNGVALMRMVGLDVGPD